MTDHTQNAQARIDEIRAIREKIPNFTFPKAKNEGRRLVSAKSVSPEFVELTLVATANNVSLTRGGAKDPEAVRDLIGYADAYGPVAEELEKLAHFIRHSVATAKHTVGNEALATYAITKRLAKLPETADLAPTAEAMSVALGRKRKAKAPQPEPLPESEQ